MLRSVNNLLHSLFFVRVKKSFLHDEQSKWKILSLLLQEIMPTLIPLHILKSTQHRRPKTFSSFMESFTEEVKAKQMSFMKERKGRDDCITVRPTKGTLWVN